MAAASAVPAPISDRRKSTRTCNPIARFGQVVQAEASSEFRSHPYAGIPDKSTNEMTRMRSRRQPPARADIDVNGECQVSKSI